MRQPGHNEVCWYATRFRREKRWIIVWLGAALTAAAEKDSRAVERWALRPRGWTETNRLAPVIAARLVAQEAGSLGRCDKVTAPKNRIDIQCEVIASS